MYARIKKNTQRGFTLIELLIVVIIIAILAAIVVPQFNSTTDDAKHATLAANLSAIRSAIELYKVQHKGANPGAKLSSGGTCTGGTKGTGAADTNTAFIEQMTMASDIEGNTCSIADSTFKYGPYVRSGMPSDPIKNVSAVAVTNTGAPIVPTADTGGWAVDTKSGQIVMNSNAKDKGTPEKAYYQY